jgi:hypothetical protein
LSEEVHLKNDDKPCAKCGHCPTCGRSNAQPVYPGTYRPYPGYPVYPWGTPYFGTTYGTSSAGVYITLS